MIFSFCRNVTAKIVVPRPNTVNVFCGKRQKFTRALPTDHTPRQTRAAGSGELFDHLVGAVAVVASGGLFRQFGHRNAIWSKRSIATTTTIANIIVSGLSKIDISNDRSEL